MNDGGLVFPGSRYEMIKQVGKEEKVAVEVTHSGMSVRDYTAIKFAASLIATISSMPDDVIARQAFGLADAMIAERDKKD